MKSILDLTFKKCGCIIPRILEILVQKMLRNVVNPEEFTELFEFLANLALKMHRSKNEIEGFCKMEFRHWHNGPRS